MFIQVVWWVVEDFLVSWECFQLVDIDVVIVGFWVVEVGYWVVYIIVYVYGGVGVDIDYFVYWYFLVVKQIEFVLGGVIGQFC